MAVYRESPDFEVVGVAEPDGSLWERASGDAAFRGLPRLGVEELLSRPGLQAVAVETGVGDLLQFGQSAVEAGLHLHLDKPPGASLPGFERLLAAATSRGLTVQLGYMYRYNPAVRLLREFLREGWLGEVFAVHAVMGKTLAPDERPPLAAFPGGIMFELGCHLVDLVVAVLGKPASVSSHLQRGADGLAENGLAVLEYPGAVATVRASATEVDGFAGRQLTVYGKAGTFHIKPLDRPAARVTLDRARGGGRYAAGTTEIPFEPPYRRYAGDAADFAAVIRREKASDFPPEHDLVVQEAVLRASGMGG
jgi:predicted dehydrogenase